MTIETYQLHRHNLVPGHEFLTFPAGEAHCKLDEIYSRNQVAVVRGADAQDMFALAMWSDALRRQEPNLKRFLMLPYLPAARADRGSPLGAKVYADFVNSLQLDAVLTIDPHSDVAPALYDRLIVADIWQAVEPAADDLREFDAVVIPDLGATKRAELVAGKLGLPTYQAAKKRDFATGKLSGFELLQEPPADARLLIVDDICDGGGTFLGLADLLDRQPDQLGLWTTHGIYSNGARDKLTEKFGWVGSTDSHPGADEPPYTGCRTHSVDILLNLMGDLL